MWSKAFQIKPYVDDFCVLTERNGNLFRIEIKDENTILYSYWDKTGPYIITARIDCYPAVYIEDWIMFII
jgi:hypothetical protein